MRKVYFRVPRGPERAGMRPSVLYISSSVLAPLYMVAAWCRGVPGLRFRLQVARLAIASLYRRPRTLPLWRIFEMLFFPMDSVRYFEFGFAWSALSTARPLTCYLDVSSPRLLPVVLLHAEPAARAAILNPDQKDLAETKVLLEEYGLADRCRLTDALIADAPFPPASFDAITCISVVEHIQEDRQAIEAMWRLLRPGGHLYLSMPCSAHAFEEYIDTNGYGLHEPDEAGFYFSQRFYDRQLIEERVFSVTGGPVRTAVYGEKRAGLFAENRVEKLTNPNYPWWREPYTMGERFRFYSCISELPGIGVVAMEFVKR